MKEGKNVGVKKQSSKYNKTIDQLWEKLLKCQEIDIGGHGSK